MNKAQVEAIMDQVFSECHALREAGQAEYAHDDQSALANFNRLASILEIPREYVLLVYLLKHIDGIAAHAKGHRSQRESVKGRINDCITYLVRLRCMVEEE